MMLPLKRDEAPLRVEVWSDDGRDYLGPGNLVGYVTVYFVRAADGTLMSRPNAETPPTPRGSERIVASANNPKIVLDSGKTVYGCQVWWKPAEEGATS